MEKIERNMKQFTATKTVKAIPMTRTDAEKFLGRSITPADPKAEEGYLLLYPDGYYSWSPKEVFEKAYRLSSTACKSKRQNFATALRLSTRSL
jgi:hypothetical protein